MEKNNKNFTLKSFREFDLQQLKELAATNYTSGSILNQAYLKWQYLDNPFGKAYMTLGFSEKDELIAQYIIVPIEFVLDGKEVLGSLSLNTLTREDFRGLGLFTKLARHTFEYCVTEGVKFTVGYPNQMSYPGFVKKLGFKYMGNIPLYIKPLKPINIIRNRLKKNNIKHGGELNIPLSSTSQIQPFNFETDRAQYTALINTVNQQKGVRLNKTFNYLKWRYNDLPTRNYKLFKIVQDNELLAVLVMKGEIVLSSKSAMILDLICADKQEIKKAVSKELKAYTRELRRNGFDLVAALSNTNNSNLTILKTTGFYKVPEKALPQPIPYIFRDHTEKLNEVFYNLHNWEVAFGDYDVF